MVDPEIRTILKTIGFDGESLNDLDDLFISRDQLLCQAKYNEIKKLIPELKKYFSSSFMTSLQKNAGKAQKWPLLNLVRQILSVYNYKMEPIRKSDGYTLEGVKKYKRFFQIKKGTKKDKDKDKEEDESSENGDNLEDDNGADKIDEEELQFTCDIHSASAFGI